MNEYLRKKKKKQKKILYSFISGFIIASVISFFTFSQVGRFFLTFVLSPSQVGSITDLSPLAVEKMVSLLNRGSEKKGKNILLLGAKNGRLVKEVFLKFKQGDQLVIYEENESFCKSLKAQNKNLSSGVEIYCGNFWHQDKLFKKTYDFILSDLPLLNWDVRKQESLFNHLEKVVHQKTVMVQSRFLGMVGIKKLFLSEEKKKRFQQNLKSFEHFKKAYQTGSVSITGNIPTVTLLFFTLDTK